MTPHKYEQKALEHVPALIRQQEEVAEREKAAKVERVVELMASLNLQRTAGVRVEPGASKRVLMCSLSTYAKEHGLPRPEVLKADRTVQGAPMPIKKARTLVEGFQELPKESVLVIPDIDLASGDNEGSVIVKDYLLNEAEFAVVGIGYAKQHTVTMAGHKINDLHYGDMPKGFMGHLDAQYRLLDFDELVQCEYIPLKAVNSEAPAAPLVSVDLSGGVRIPKPGTSRPIVARQPVPIEYGGTTL